MADGQQGDQHGQGQKGDARCRKREVHCHISWCRRLEQAGGQKRGQHGDGAGEQGGNGGVLSSHGVDLLNRCCDAHHMRLPNAVFKLRKGHELDLIY